MARFVKSEDKPKLQAQLRSVSPQQSRAQQWAASRTERGLSRASARAAGRTAARERAKAPKASLQHDPEWAKKHAQMRQGYGNEQMRQGSSVPKRPMPKQPYLEGKTRTKMLMSNPPIKVVERYTNGKWVEVSRQRQAKSGGFKQRPKRGMSLGTAIKRMQRDQPWN